jgi:hypothetical protein
VATDDHRWDAEGGKPLRILLAKRSAQPVSGPHGSLRALQQRCIVRVSDVGHQHAQRGGDARQKLRQGIGSEVQTPRCRQNAFPGWRVDRVTAAVQDTRDGGHGHACRTRHVPDRGHPSHLGQVARRPFRRNRFPHNSCTGDAPGGQCRPHLRPATVCHPHRQGTRLAVLERPSPRPYPPPPSRHPRTTASAIRTTRAIMRTL